MTSFRSLIFAALVALLTACGGSDTGDVATDPPMDAAPDAVAEEVVIDIESDEAANAVLEAIEESAADQEPGLAEIEDAIVLAETEPESTVKSQPEWRYAAEKHFTMLTTAQGTSSSPDVIEVTEVFWYGCSHCYNFDPYLNNWKQDLPDDVNFVRMPVMWNPTNQIHARMFYTAEALGKLDDVHDAIFRSIHLDRQTLTTEDSIRDFLSEYGISEEEFDSTFRSFAVESKLKRAKNLTQRYRIQSVPLLVTNGKYLTEGSEIKNFEDMLAVTDELIERERQAL